MITLGLRKIVVTRPELSASVVRALTEIVAWCLSRSQDSDGLRSSELNPAASLEVPRFGEYPLDIWVEKKKESYVRATRTMSECVRLLCITRG